MNCVDILKKGRKEASALSGLGRHSLTYGGLLSLTSKVVSRLNELGAGRNDPVAIVLPNGPEMAAAFVTIASGAATAPLNPGYREEELEFYLTDLQAKLLVVAEEYDGPARYVAKRLGIRIANLRRIDEGPAGSFELVGESVNKDPASGGFAKEEDVALVLHTSGTTSRPKIVPLTHVNICSSAVNIAGGLSLTSDDCCLNIMPLFHIHGLIGAVLSSLSAGASVWCSPGFDALRFFSWMREANPSWYTAVPTMHQAILSRASKNRDVIESSRLRFVRSSSSSLAPQVMNDLEQTFGAPVIEAYGMTEASHQMASNPLPPAVRKPGTVGLAAGPEVSVIDLNGDHVSPGKIGEVVIRGKSVTKGYLKNPEANASAFLDGWFRTGDQGVLDDEGYLRLTGRLKEIINRGGEKISPREVDEVLIAHPDVAQAVTFAIPHLKLGEEVAAAIVLKETSKTTVKEIRAFASKRLADFKVPKRIMILDEIPKGPTGKLQRIGLAEKLGLS